MRLEIVPYLGINNILFDSTQSTVNKILGKPIKIEIDNIMEEVRQSTKGLINVFIENKLSDIIVNENENLFYDNIDIFGSDAIDKLKKLDPPKAGRTGYLLFEKIGICLGGFSTKKIPEGKIAIVFCRNRLNYYKLFIDM